MLLKKKNGQVLNLLPQKKEDIEQRLPNPNTPSTRVFTSDA